MIILCGMPKSGKTTIGQHLARALHYTFIDIDLPDSRKHYQELGEKKFREREKERMHALNPPKESVIALGGGSLEDPSNHSLVLSWGAVYYLKINKNRLFERMQNKGFPQFIQSREELNQLMKKREPIYHQVAQKIIDVSDKSPEQIVKEILNGK